MYSVKKAGKTDWWTWSFLNHYLQYCCTNFLGDNNKKTMESKPEEHTYLKKQHTFSGGANYDCFRLCSYPEEITVQHS